MQRLHSRAMIVCAAALVIMASLLAGCGDSESDDLEGGAWALVTLGGQPAQAGGDASMTFGEDGALSGSTGCNLFSGSWERDGDTLTLSPGALTQRACPEPLMAQEQQFLAALAATTRYRLDDDRLTLEDEQGAELAVFETLAAAELTGSTWNALSYNNGAQGVVSVLADAPITAMFTEDGQYSGNSGCNDYSGDYELDGDTLTLGPFIITERACDQPVMDQERLYLAALENVKRLTLGASTLELRDADGSLQVSYQAAP